MTRISAYFKGAYERMLALATVFIVAILAFSILWAVDVLLNILRTVVAPPPPAAIARGFAVDEARTFLEGRGTALPEK